MMHNGHNQNHAAAGNNGHAQVLHWPGRLLTADDLRGALNGHRELQVGPKTLVTPLVVDELKARGVRLVRGGQDTAPTTNAKAAASAWHYAQQTASGMVDSVIAALGRDGLVLTPISGDGSVKLARWTRVLAEQVSRDAAHLVLFCADAGLVCCVANKIKGVRAAAIVSVAQARRVAVSVAPNLVAIELPGPTFFEIKQMLRTVCVARGLNSELAATLQEVEASHAHR